MGLMRRAKKEITATATATSTSTSTLTSEEGRTLRSEASSQSSSSIGQPDDDTDADDDNEEEEDVQSTLSSLASLEDSLPIKKGLSNFYGGKSKSYGNLGEVRSLQVQDLGKSDNPFNKRRRTLMAYNLMFKDHNNSTSQKQQNISNSASNYSRLFYAHSNHISMPLLPLAEHHDDDNGVDDSSDDYYATPTTSFLSPPPRLQHQHQPYPSLINNTSPTVNATSSAAAHTSPPYQ